ncbi:aldehyde dehydrogenase family protein [Plantibacter sp. YIM 135347]|uniref:aldehyde dehydrogenase family protein n=1 Tax=Plantibacter sp. YIM 135347 TaxID=3423919 RepID=UPI003D3421A8
MTTPLLHFIDGSWIEGAGEEIVDENPSRPDDIVASGRAATTPDVERAITAAARAGKAWAATPAQERAAVLLRAAAIVERHIPDWGEELSREEGKTLVEGRGEVFRSAEILRYFAHESEREQGELFASSRRGERILVVRRPVGVIAVITPFNFPIAIPVWKIAPALVTGNTVVWKPATVVPLLAMRFAQALEEAGLPPGVLSLVIGSPSVGQALVSHPRVDAVTFTGSTAVGRGIAAELAGRGVPFQGEMGGKNASVVLADADLDLAVEQVALGAFRATGQKCTATSRVVVHDAVADEFIERFAARARAIVVGESIDPASDMGPVIDGRAKSNLQAAVSRAVSEGVQPIVLPETYESGLLADGHFIAPTVFALAEGGPDELWRRELFGPVVGIRRATSTDHAMDLVNDSEYGLSAAVFTRDLGRALAAIDDVRVGVLHVNSESAGADPHVPFGGTKGSGLGPKEQGGVARDFFTETTTVYLRGGDA